MTALDPRGAALAGLLQRYRLDGRTAWLEATGASMDPLIPAGSHLMVEFGAFPERLGEVGNRVSARDRQHSLIVHERREALQCFFRESAQCHDCLQVAHA